MNGVIYTDQATAIADYQAYADYEYSGGVAAAQSFIAAARYLLLVRPNEVGNQGANVTLNNATLQAEIDRARVYITRMSSAAPTVKILGVDSNFKGTGQAGLG